MLYIPETLRDIYPNPVQDVNSVPVVVFRDHRWTLPVIHLAKSQGIIEKPATVIGFDRHPDALEPACGYERLAAFASRNGSLDELTDLVGNALSSRDDDWIRAGMELGIIGDMLSFSSNSDVETVWDDSRSILKHTDAAGAEHWYYRVGRPQDELSYKGALADCEHPMVSNGLWNNTGWDESKRCFWPPDGQYVLDIDLDYWTISWNTYTFPFPDEVFRGEFDTQVQSQPDVSYPIQTFYDSLIQNASLITITTEPDFCGGGQHAEQILILLNTYLFNSKLAIQKLIADYHPCYPNE